MHNHNFVLLGIILGNNLVDRVPICKLLGVYISNYYINEWMNEWMNENCNVL